jgi:hypothetical protein
MHRIQPQLPVQAYKTYALRQRPAPRAREASCAEVDCPNYLHGWRTSLDPLIHGAQIAHVRADRTRKHVETRSVDGRVVFTFEAGQTCFQTHHVEMRTLYLVRGGDWRAVTQPGRQLRSDQWVDDFGEHQQTLADRLAQG